jgi:hypothetical protein
MAMDSDKSAVKYTFQELFEALSLVVELAQGNCLDPDDPDVANEANRQLSATDLVKQFIAANSPESRLILDMALIPPMDRYEVENAAFRIDGYFLPKPHECGNQGEMNAFDRAKSECLYHLARGLVCTKALSVEQFFQATKRKIPT